MDGSFQIALGPRKICPNVKGKMQGELPQKLRPREQLIYHAIPCLITPLPLGPTDPHLVNRIFLGASATVTRTVKKRESSVSNPRLLSDSDNQAHGPLFFFHE
ncbi:Os02g0802750 [Oryza sativa Japonica Group]|jgi:hypothetical protein|uniref:Os02g0802750 protein n=1 Tax=Oryza sativa subsp. japonica TaxID=39947 RepID=A0A0P0VQS9_ORYSJ|nr:Os02g0802750 [Oryza sativa Japonica Group]